jgi:hypothetical protein
MQKIVPLWQKYITQEEAENLLLPLCPEGLIGVDYKIDLLLDKKKRYTFPNAILFSQIKKFFTFGEFLNYFRFST